jgi:hypothetical protein
LKEVDCDERTRLWWAHQNGKSLPRWGQQHVYKSRENRFRVTVQRGRGNDEEREAV